MKPLQKRLEMLVAEGTLQYGPPHALPPQETPSEHYRRLLVDKLQKEATSDPVELSRRHGEIWDSEALQRDFKVLGFMAPFCVVRRKSDQKVGSLLFQHLPRYYFSFEGS